MRARAPVRVVAAAVAGFLGGAVATRAVQSRGLQVPAVGPRGRVTEPVTRPQPPTTFLAWVPNGLPPGFAADVRSLADIDRVAAVSEDNVWMTRSWATDGTPVDRPRAPFMIPVDAAAVEPRAFAAFLPPSDRALVADLARGAGVLGATSAELRGLGPGSVMRFDGGTQVPIAAVLPDDLVGAAELLVSDRTGTRIGIRQQRYLLVQPRPGHGLSSSRTLKRRLTQLLPHDLTGNARQVQVRAPGETPFFRAGDAVMPPALIKTVFGEFAARPDPGRPGYLQLDPRWIRTHIVSTTLPVLGTVTCNRALIPQLRGAMEELQRRGLGSLVHSYDGCFAPRFINRIPTAMISHHAWGAAVDLNAATNPFGAPPDQDPRLVHVLERWGFIWGGSFIVPDGNHFEYRRPAPNT